MQNFNPVKRILLIILDGVGVKAHYNGNAVTKAQPQNLLSLWNTSPHTYLRASGDAVGLPDKTNGNSEVGHLNLGAGRVVFQNLAKINKKMASGEFMNNAMLEAGLKHAIEHNSKIHVMGCLSDGGTHSHISHFKAVLRFFAQHKFDGDLLLHAFTDGRDSPPKSAKKYLAQIDNYMEKEHVGKIATLCGRSLAMDRNQNWDRTEKAYNLLVQGNGETFDDWATAVAHWYENSKTDEFFGPSIVTTENTKITENDVIFFLNFRADRALQLSHAFVDIDFKEFPTSKLQNIFFASMTEYAKDFPKNVLFPKEKLKLPLGRILSERGMTQLRIAESEKFPHVTYFFNGGLNIKYDGENRIKVPSPDLLLYDKKPEMSAFEVTEILKKRIESEYYNFIVLNFANGDMVGHTGNLEATILAVQTIDYCVGELVKTMQAHNGITIITADHGNAEELINQKTGEVDTEHSLNPVPFIVVHPELKDKAMPLGKLSNVAPTILKLFGINQPSEMSESSLL